MGGGRAGPDNKPTRRAPSANKAPLVWRAPEDPNGLTAAPVGGGEAWPGFETTHKHTSADPAPLV